MVGRVELTFDDVLEIHVDGQLDGHAVLGRTLGPAIRDDLPACPVALGEDKSVFAAQVGIHHHFDALDAAALMVEEPEDVAEALFVGIESARLGFAHHPAQAGRGQFFLHRGDAHSVDLLFYNDVRIIRRNGGRDLLF